MPVWTAHDVVRAVRVPSGADDKYSRGVVGLRTGSLDYPGAAVLGAEAATRGGAGMVRYVGPTRVAAHVVAVRPEVVVGPGRVQAWVIGSGTDPETRSAAETIALQELLAGDVPVVVDAGALDLVEPHAAAPIVVTPHAREHDRLRERIGCGPVPHDVDTGRRQAAAVETAQALGATVLLKGFTTIVAKPDGWSASVSAATGWLATAGAGDVLAGLLGALLAGNSADLGAAAASAAWLHGRAAVHAARGYGRAGAPIVAMEVAAAIPVAIGELLSPPGVSAPIS